MVANSIDSLNMQQNFVHEAEVDGIEILVNMAKQGKIDPWNVNIVDVTDKYLMHLFQSKAQNLRLTGRTLLFAAILLKLKSNILEGLDVMDFEPQHEEDFNYDDDNILDYGQENDVPTSNIISIDEVLQRRTSVRLNHNRVVTLRDLIRQLEFYEKLEKKQSLQQAHERILHRILLRPLQHRMLQNMCHPRVILRHRPETQRKQILAVRRLQAHHLQTTVVTIALRSQPMLGKDRRVKQGKHRRYCNLISQNT